MSDYAYAKHDFEKWIDANFDLLKDYEKAIVNVLYNTFDEFTATPIWNPIRNRSKQGGLVDEIKHIDFDNLNIKKPNLPEKGPERIPLKYLTSLTVKNFRGFGDEECRFEFKNNNGKVTLYNLFYGSNGSGKTSFCEALEYCILGTVEEANAKGIPVEKYIRHSECIEKKSENEHVKEEKINELTLEYVNDPFGIENKVGETNKKFVTSKSALEQFRFAFIERNRIDGFSRIGSGNMGDTRQRLATLFGHAQFLDFVNKFSNITILPKELLSEEMRIKTQTVNVPQNILNDLIQKAVDNFLSGTTGKQFIELCEAFENIKDKLDEYVDELLIDTGIQKFLNDARDLYNIMNDDDRDFEGLKKIEIQDGYIKIVFEDQRRGEGNALHLLSEGHIKLLGLSLLLAKALKDDVPFLVFDDIVNAIDDDHRDGIAKMLMTHKESKGTEDLQNKLYAKQLFLTCHGDVFLDQLKKYVTDKDDPDKKLISVFRFIREEHKSNHKYGIEFTKDDESAKTKIQQAIDYINADKKRECATACRQALEIITEQIWKNLGKALQMRFVLEKPHQRIDLRTLVEQIRSETGPDANNDLYKANLQDIHEALKEIETYMNVLNKGVHEDSSTREFTHKEIEKITKLIIKMVKQREMIKKTVEEYEEFTRVKKIWCAGSKVGAINKQFKKNNVSNPEQERADDVSKKAQELNNKLQKLNNDINCLKKFLGKTEILQSTNENDIQMLNDVRLLRERFEAELKEFGDPLDDLERDIEVDYRSLIKIIKSFDNIVEGKLNYFVKFGKNDSDLDLVQES